MTDAGLSSAEAAARLAASGPNVLREPPSPSPLTILGRQFQGLVMWVLVGAVVLSAVLGDWVEAAAIAALLVLNGFVGFLQEWRAESALAALRSLGAPRATVLRDGRASVVPAREIVRGDLMLLEAGDLVAADGRVVESASLETNEALLTGESLPASKRRVPDGTADEEEARAGSVFAGTSVARGQGRAVVTATGMDTELGRIAHLLESAERGRTPLQRRLDQVSRRLILLCAAIVVAIFALGLWRGEPLFDMLLTALSLAVAAIPEGLPTVVTLALAVGVQRMARRQALVRNMAAVETLGTAQIICSDKTGTLTTGELRVRSLWMPGGDADHLRRRLRHAAAAASDAEVRGEPERPVIVGDPTEGALLLDAEADAIRRPEIETAEPRVLVVPFDSERKRMSIVRRSNGGLVVYVKGAPEAILPLCARAAQDGGESPFDESQQRQALAQTRRFAAGALRVLAIAERRLPAGALPESVDPAAIEADLTFLGLAALADAPRPEAREAVRRCEAAGIRVVMITGDHPVTGAAVARELGILKEAGGEEPGRILDGRALDALDDEGLAAAAARVAVYARVTPAHKLRIVRALKRDGFVVAMTGDGVNDAPAIRESSVGIAMGRSGTEVAKQAADIVVTDDNFASIVNAVEEGRRIFDNIQRTLLYLLAGNLGEVLVMLVGVLAGWPVPFLPVHLLWVNFVTDGFPALTLATEAVHPEALRRPPRPADAEFADAAFLRRAALAGSCIALAALAGFWIGWQGQDAPRGRALAFATLVLSHVTWAFAARSRSRTFFSLGAFSNLRLLIVVGATLLIQGAVQSVPAVARLFSLPAMAWSEWLIAAALGLLPVTIVEVSKLARRASPAAR